MMNLEWETVSTFILRFEFTHVAARASGVQVLPPEEGHPEEGVHRQCDHLGLDTFI